MTHIPPPTQYADFLRLETPVSPGIIDLKMGQSGQKRRCKGENEQMIVQYYDDCR